jgi:hypothetical protein
VQAAAGLIACPLYPQKRTLELSREMSAMCQKRTSPPYSNAKMRFQSFFMLITVQPLFFPSS